MYKLWTIGYGLFVLGGISMVATFIAWMVAMVVTLTWSPGELTELLIHVMCSLVVSFVLSIAGAVLAKFSEMKGEG